MKNNNKGFSLVELIVVIAIMAVLVGVLAPTLLRYVEKSRIQKDESAAEEFRNAVVLELADEAVFKEVATGAKVTVSTTDVVYTPAASGTDTGTKLIAGVKETCGTGRVWSSNAHKTQSYVITIAINGYNVTATGAWQ